MTAPKETMRFASTTPLAESIGAVRATQVAAVTRERWRQGERPDVAAVLQQNPDLKRYRSLVLDLAYEEYRRRLDAGESLQAADFAGRFPSFQQSLHLLIEVHRLLGDDAEWGAGQGEIAWPCPGESLLGFSLLAELGRGTFGRVFLASEETLGSRRVALKVAHQGGHEAHVLGRLSHRNIVPVYSVKEDEATGLTAVCMPYLGRATLSDLLDRAYADPHRPVGARMILETIESLRDDSDAAEAIPPARILRKGSYVEGIIHLGIQLADALAYTHARGICHRDLKPSNVLLSQDGRPLLLDFNLSQDQRTDAPGRRHVALHGPGATGSTVLAEPEHRGPADLRSDLFSLGVILYQLLSGRLPFGEISWEGGLQQTARRLLSTQRDGPIALRSLNRQVDRRLAHWIDRCLAFAPEDRPETAAELAAGLRRMLTPPRRLQRWVGRHRRGVALAGLVVLVVGLSVGAFFALRDPYSVRQFRLGQQQYAQGEYEAALKSFDDSLRSEPGVREALIARGMAYAQLKEFSWAFDDFDAADKLRREGRLQACKGYCLAQRTFNDVAIAAGESALKMGFDSPAVLNNLGFSCIQLSRLDDAEKYLDRAMEKGADLPEVQYNRLRIYLLRAAAGAPIGPEALACAKKAGEIGVPSAMLYHNVAKIYSYAAKQDPRWVQPALEYLEKALDCNLNPAELTWGSVFKVLSQERKFAELLARPAPAGPPVPDVRLILP